MPANGKHAIHTGTQHSDSGQLVCPLPTCLRSMLKLEDEYLTISIFLYSRPSTRVDTLLTCVCDSILEHHMLSSRILFSLWKYSTVVTIVICISGGVRVAKLIIPFSLFSSSVWLPIYFYTVLSVVVRSTGCICMHWMRHCPIHYLILSQPRMYYLTPLSVPSKRSAQIGSLRYFWEPPATRLYESRVPLFSVHRLTTAHERQCTHVPWLSAMQHRAIPHLAIWVHWVTLVCIFLALCVTLPSWPEFIMCRCISTTLLGIP